MSTFSEREWRVTYWQAGGNQVRRVFQLEPAAQRFMQRLWNYGMQCEIEHRPTGKWKVGF